MTINRAFFLSLFTLVLFRAAAAVAYPDFIGYGYTSCVTCHFNTQGMGPLNDYGRALYAGEIAARDGIPETTTDEELGAASGFLGKKELPWWLRPSFKYRGLWFQTEPGSTATVKKYVVMQEDVNLTLIFDKNQKFVFQGNLGLAFRRGAGGYNQETWLSREHYLRWQASKTIFVSAGMLDKVFGLRLVDHTAFSRAKLGLNQYNSTIGTLTHGIVVQSNTTAREYTGHVFLGNLNEEDRDRQKGASFMAEYSTGEKARSGGSALYSTSDSNVKKMAIAAHQKMGLSHGSSLLAEIGYHKDDDSARSIATTGTYLYAQSTVLIRRGYNFFSLAEYYRSKTSQPSGEVEAPDLFRWGLGFLTFPLPRTEFRLTAQDLRFWSAENGAKDSWVIQAQLHLSL